MVLFLPKSNIKKLRCFLWYESFSLQGTVNCVCETIPNSSEIGFSQSIRLSSDLNFSVTNSTNSSAWFSVTILVNMIKLSYNK